MLKIEKSLNSLRIGGSIKVVKIDVDVFKIFVNDLYFGTYSNIENTFVD